MDIIEIALEIAVLALLCLASFSLYMFLIASVIPKRLLKITYDAKEHLGRGLEKFVYPDGRAVTYEPHPSIRKYVKKYALFTLDGYKYIQLCVADTVKSYSARIVSFDNRSRAIDNVDIFENLNSASSSRPLRLHGRTSYVAFVLTEVNGKKQYAAPYMKTELRSILYYFAATFAATFLEVLHIMLTLDSVAVLTDGPSVEVKSSFLLLTALIVGVGCLAVTLVGRIKKGIRVVLK